MMKQYERKARFTELKPYDIFAKEHDFMEVCEWNNGEGLMSQKTNSSSRLLGDNGNVCKHWLLLKVEE